MALVMGPLLGRIASGYYSLIKQVPLVNRCATLIRVVGYKIITMRAIM